MPPRGRAGAGPAAPQRASQSPPGLTLPAWAVATDVAVSDPSTYTSAYAAESAPLILQDGRSSPRRLPLFGAAHVRGRGGAAGAAANAPSTQSVEAGVATDAVCFAGGPVWALDWCGQTVRESGGDRWSRYFAVGRPVSGPALIQVWRLPVAPPTAGAGRAGTAPALPPTPAALPRPALALAHGGGLAWDVKWRPGVADVCVAGGRGPPLLGVLAAALGDGTLAVWGVPAPGALGGGGGGGGGGGTAAAATAAPASKKRKAPAGALVPASPPTRPTPPILALPPAAAARTGLPSALEWCPSPPHDLLAAACWDGSALLWRVGEWGGGDGAPPPQPPGPLWEDGGGSGGGGGGAAAPFVLHGLTPLLRVQAEASPLRAVAWPPPPTLTSHAGSPPLTAFATVGHAADLCVWDASRPAHPALGVALPREWALGAAWVASPPGLLIAHDGGRLTFAPLDAGVPAATQALPLDGYGEAWSVHVLSSGHGGGHGGGHGPPLAAYGVGAGDVGVFEVKGSVKSRTHTVHRVVAGFRRRQPAQLQQHADRQQPAGRGRGRGRGEGAPGPGRGRGSERAPPALPAALTSAAVGAPVDTTLVLPPARTLARDACVYRVGSSGAAATKAAAARSALPDEGLAVTRVRWGGWAGGVSSRAWAWLASAGGGGVVRLQLVDGLEGGV